jgi:diacylglycerol kinase (ATP)
MTESPTVVIANPRSGREISPSRLEALLAGFEASRLRWTEGPGHATLLAQEAVSRGAPLVVAAGGDGTINEVVAGLTLVPGKGDLAILPFGTGNDLARSLGIPLDLLEAAAIALGGRTRSIDLVAVDGARPGLMANASVAGLGGDLTQGLDLELKRTWGPAVYLRMALDELGAAAGFAIEIRLDDQVLELESTNVVVANGRYLGGGIPVAPAASLDDGLLDVVVLPALSTARLFGLVPRVLAGRQLRSRHVLHRRARRVRVAAAGPMPVTIDGEPAGSEPISYEVKPGALRVRCPDADPLTVPYRLG